MHRNPKTLTTFFSSGTKRLLTFLTFSFSTRGERDTIFTMLTVPTSPTVTPQLNCPAQSPISTNWPNKHAGLPSPRFKSQLASFGVKSQLTAFFKNHQIPRPSLPGMTSFTPQSYFPSQVFIMISVIVISSAHERELFSCVHQHVPNSSKPNQTER